MDGKAKACYGRIGVALQPGSPGPFWYCGCQLCRRVHSFPGLSGPGKVNCGKQGHNFSGLAPPGLVNPWCGHLPMWGVQLPQFCRPWGGQPTKEGLQIFQPGRPYVGQMWTKEQSFPSIVFQGLSGHQALGRQVSSGRMGSIFPILDPQGIACLERCAM